MNVARVNLFGSMRHRAGWSRSRSPSSDLVVVARVNLFRSMKHRIARTCATLLKIEYRCWYGGVGARSDHGCIYPAREPAATTLELAVPRATPRRLRPRVAAVRRPLHPHRQRCRLARIAAAPDEVVPGSGLRPHPLGHAVDLVVGDVVFEDEVAALLSLPPRRAEVSPSALVDEQGSARSQGDGPRRRRRACRPPRSGRPARPPAPAPTPPPPAPTSQPCAHPPRVSLASCYVAHKFLRAAYRFVKVQPSIESASLGRVASCQQRRPHAHTPGPPHDGAGSVCKDGPRPGRFWSSR